MGKQQGDVIKNNGAGVSVNSKAFSLSGHWAGASSGDLEDVPCSLAKEGWRDSIGPEVTPPAAALDPVSDWEWLKRAVCFKRQRKVTPQSPTE